MKKGCCVRNWLLALMTDQKGATAVEYGLIIALVVLAMLAALNGVADATLRMWEHVSTTSVEAMSNS